MTVLESFQDRSFRFSLEILKLYRKLRACNDLPFHVANQLVRAGTSIGANLEEAKSAYSRRDLASKQTIALREARETHYWLRVAKTEQPQLTEEIDVLLDECAELVAMLTSSVRKLRAEKAASAIVAVFVGSSLLHFVVTFGF